MTEGGLIGYRPGADSGGLPPRVLTLRRDAKAIPTATESKLRRKKRKEVRVAETRLREEVRQIGEACGEWAASQIQWMELGEEWNWVSRFSGGFSWEGKEHYRGVARSYGRTVLADLGPNSEGRIVLERMFIVENDSDKPIGIEVNMQRVGQYEIRMGEMIMGAGELPRVSDGPEPSSRSVIITPTSITFDRRSVADPDTAPNLLAVVRHELDLLSAAKGRLCIGYAPQRNWRTS